MKALLAVAAVCVAGLGSGCDGVFGDFTIPTRPFTINAVSDDSGTLATGQIRVHTIGQDFVMYVTCLNVVGDKATIGASFPRGPEPTVGRIYYVEDLPGEHADVAQEELLDAPPTSCPAPPATIRQDTAGGDMAIFDDVQPDS